MMSMLPFSVRSAMELMRSHILGSDSPSNLSMPVGLKVAGYWMVWSRLEKAEKPSRSLQGSSLSMSCACCCGGLLFRRSRFCQSVSGAPYLCRTGNDGPAQLRHARGGGC